MPDSILGIKISELPEATESELTDASDTVVDDGTTTRKTKLSTFVSFIKQKLRIGTAANLDTTSKEIVGAVNEVNESLSKLKTSVNRRYYQILSVQAVSLTTTTQVDSGARTTLSGTFSAVSGATHYYPFLRGSNWLTPGNASISENTIKCEFINQTDGKHSGGGYFYVVALKQVSAI